MRKMALKIIKEGLESIKPNRVIPKKIKLKRDLLIIKDYKNKTTQINLKKYKKIIVIGFGKAISLIGKELEKILGAKIDDGLIIDNKKTKLKRIKVLLGTHPMPSRKNILATQKLVKLIKNLDKNDLVICLVAGGGSALLCSPNINFDQYLKIIKKNYQAGIDIKKFNRIRKKFSQVKDGKLAKLTKAKIVSLIFSDVVGDDLSSIASGPTVSKNLPNVKNILLLNNQTPLKVMEKTALSLHFKPVILTNRLEGEARIVGKNIIRKAKRIRNKNCFLFGGETTVKVNPVCKGLGGRNQELCLAAVSEMAKLKKAVLISINTDNKDGNTNAAGAIVDEKTKAKAIKLGLNEQQFLYNHNSYYFFKKLDGLIFIRQAGINLADLGLILIREK